MTYEVFEPLTGTPERKNSSDVPVIPSDAEREECADVECSEVAVFSLTKARNIIMSKATHSRPVHAVVRVDGMTKLVSDGVMNSEDGVIYFVKATLEVELKKSLQTKVEVLIMRKSPTADDILGSCSFDVESNSKTIEEWMSLFDKGKRAGEVQLRLEMQSNEQEVGAMQKHKEGERERKGNR